MCGGGGGGEGAEITRADFQQTPPNFGTLLVQCCIMGHDSPNLVLT